LSVGGIRGEHGFAAQRVTADYSIVIARKRADCDGTHDPHDLLNGRDGRNPIIRINAGSAILGFQLEVLGGGF